MNNAVILSIDQGTSGSKAIIFSLQGEILASFTSDYEITYPKPGFVEIDPGELLVSVYAAIEGTLESFEEKGGNRNDIQSIGISNQRESFLLWDEEGTPLSPVVVWQCKRSADLCKQLASDEKLNDLIRERTGLIIDPYFSGTKAAVIVGENRDLRDRVSRGTAFFGTVDSWLIWSLTGGSVHATDYTNASRTMLFDINNLAWDQQIIEIFGLSGLRMPEARPSDAGFGSTDINGLLKSPVAIGAVIGDSHAAAIGEGLFRPGEAKVTLGTGSSILMNVGPEPVSSSNGMVSTICWSAGDRVDYALEGIIVSCGSTLTWLRDKLNLVSSSKEIDELAESIDGTDGVYLIPGFSGLGAPWWKLDAKASIVGLDFGHDRRHVARAALESISFQVADVLSAMVADSGRRLSGIKVDGGITVSNIVMKSIASLLERPAYIPLMKEASAWGAALLAGLNSHLYSDLDEIDGIIRSRETRIIRADSDSNLLERYQGWKTLLQDY